MKRPQMALLNFSVGGVSVQDITVAVGEYKVLIRHFVVLLVEPSR